MVDWRGFSAIELIGSLADGSNELNFLSDIMKREIFRDPLEQILNDFLGAHEPALRGPFTEFNARLPCPPRPPVAERCSNRHFDSNMSGAL